MFASGIDHVVLRLIKLFAITEKTVNIKCGTRVANDSSSINDQYQNNAHVCPVLYAVGFYLVFFLFIN